MKTALVTGAAAGIGKAVALKFLAEGYRVIGMSRREAADFTHPNFTYVSGDVSVTADRERLIDTARQIDVLVNAAGIVVDGSVETADMADWDRSMDTNGKSVFMLSRLAMPYLRRTKGSIVNVASVAALKGLKNRAIYSATKGAMIALSQSMAAEHIADGVRVNCVSPGTVLSPSLQGRIDSTDDPAAAMQNFVARQPMGRLGTSEEVAKAIVFAAGQGIGFMSGANIVVDGGMTI